MGVFQQLQTGNKKSGGVFSLLETQKQTKWEEENQRQEQTAKAAGVPSVASAISAPLGVTRKQLETVQPIQVSTKEKETGVFSKIKSVLDAANTFTESVSNELSFGLTNKLLRSKEEVQEQKDSIAGKAGSIAGSFAPIGGAYKLAGGLTKSALQNAPRLVDLAVKGGVAGTLYGAAKEGVDAALDTRMDGSQGLGQRATNVAKEAALFAAGDAALGGAGMALRKFAGTKIGESLTNLVKRKQSIAPEVEQQITEALAPKTVSLPGVLKNANQEQYINRVMSDIRQIVTERMTPPLENPNELAKWLKPHLGEASLNEVRKLPYEDMVELANEVRTSLSTADIAAQVAKEHGYNLMDILEGKLPSINQRVQQYASRRAYGVYDAPTLNISRPVSDTPVMRPLRFTPEIPTIRNQISQSAPLESLRNSANDLGEGLGNFGGGAVDAMYDALWKKVVKGDVTEGGSPSALLQVAKLVRDNGGLKTQDDFRRLAADVTAARNKGLTGPAYQNELRNVATKHISTSKSPASPVQASAIPPRTQTKSNPNERGLVTNLRESGKLTPEVQAGLEASSKRTYTPITNAATVERANAKITKDMAAAESAVLNTRGRLTADKVATGFRLIDEYQKAGDINRAVSMAENLATKLTEAGQAVQAASIWNRLTPEGALVAATRKVEAINQRLPKGAADVVLTEKNATDIMTAAQAIQIAGVSKERAGNVIEILDNLKAGKQITAEEKQIVSDFVKDAQQFVKPPKQTIVREARPPKELAEPRVRDKVVSFMDEAEKAAMERIKARRNRLSSTPFDEWADYAIVGASKLVKGGVKFADWSTEMVKTFGEEIRPQLQAIYQKAQEQLTINTKRISQERITQAERIAETYLKKNETKLATTDIDFVRNIAKNVSELSGDAQRAASQDLQAVLNGFERAGVGQKLSSAQYISMLLNPKTQIRNIVGNEMLYRIERIQRMAATPIDFAVSKLTGTDRQITFKRGPMSWDNFFSPTTSFMKSLGEGAKAGWRGVNPEGLTTAYDISGQAFKSKLNPITYLEKALGATMKGFDYAAYNRAVDGRLREMAYLDAINKGVKGRQAQQAHIDRHIANLDNNIADVAKEFGRYITLQDETTLSRSLSRLKRGANKLTTGSENFGVGSLVIPFAKTPANLLLRAIDYSPAGFAKAITQGYQILQSRNTDLTRADVIQSVTRALFGTGLSGVGVWLASKGALRGETSPDVDVRELEKAAGLSQYQLNASAVGRMFDAMVTGNLSDVDKAAKPQPGDTFYQYEWAQPSSIPLALGANIINERRQAAKDLLKTGKTEGLPKQATDVTLGALNTLFNTSVLQGIQQAFEFAPGESNKVKAFAINVLKQIPTMATPSFISQINQIMDNKLRENYSPDFTEGLLNPARSRVPIAAQGMEQKVGTLGQPQTRLDNVFDVFLNPAQRSVYKPTKEAQMVMELLSDTGDDTLAPRRVSKYITGTDPVTRAQKRVDLTTEQYVRYQTIVGQEVAKQLGRIPANATTQTKVKRIKDILTDAGEKGRKEMKKELNLR